MPFRRSEPIVAIDGPSGAGKSTLSTLLARRFGYVKIDTGAMYRCVALASRRAAIHPEDGEALSRLVRELDIRFSSDGERVLLGAEDVSEAIREPEISLLTSRVSACPEVREALVALQRRMGEHGGVVLEGRDIGTVVFPRAEVKLFLTASAEERGRRRYEELRAKGIAVDLDQTVEEVRARDEADQSRTHSPLFRAQDAVLIDSTGKGVGQVLDEMAAIVESRRTRMKHGGESSEEER